jgi:hypothetical protein
MLKQKAERKAKIWGSGKVKQRYGIIGQRDGKGKERKAKIC